MDVDVPFAWDASQAPLIDSFVEGLIPTTFSLRVMAKLGLNVNPGFLKIYQVLFQLSYLARGNQFGWPLFVT